MDRHISKWLKLHHKYGPLNIELLPAVGSFQNPHGTSKQAIVLIHNSSGGVFQAFPPKTVSETLQKNKKQKQTIITESGKTAEIIFWLKIE